MPAERFVISGRVQGVGYRWWAVGAARRLGISGWVRNRRDGTVEIHAVAERGLLDTFAVACAKGPPESRVVEVVRLPAEDEDYPGFEQYPTE